MFWQSLIVLSLEEATCNSQGCEPLERVKSNIGEPQRGDIVSPLRRFLSPFQGFRFTWGDYQGFTPLAIICRPVGASEPIGLDVDRQFDP